MGLIGLARLIAVLLLVLIYLVCLPLNRRKKALDDVLRVVLIFGLIFVLGPYVLAGIAWIASNKSLHQAAGHGAAIFGGFVLLAFDLFIAYATVTDVKGKPLNEKFAAIFFAGSAIPALVAFVGLALRTYEFLLGYAGWAVLLFVMGLLCLPDAYASPAKVLSTIFQVFTVLFGALGVGALIGFAVNPNRPLGLIAAVLCVLALLFAWVRGSLTLTPSAVV